MTHSGGKPHTNVGDRGQRYEVTFIDGSGIVRVMGWTNEDDGGALVESINLHPVWHSPRVIDRHADEVPK